jgi:hypothetical protein
MGFFVSDSAQSVRAGHFGQQYNSLLVGKASGEYRILLSPVGMVNLSAYFLSVGVGISFGMFVV